MSETESSLCKVFICLLVFMAICGISADTYISLKEIEVKAAAVEALKSNIELKLDLKDLKDILK